MATFSEIIYTNSREYSYIQFDLDNATAALSTGGNYAGTYIITPDAGYSIKSDNLKVSNTGGSGGTTTITLSDNEDGTVTAKLSNSDFYKCHGTVSGAATAETTTVSITQTLTHCTSDAPSTATAGESLTVTLTAESGYVFDDTPTITGGTFTVSDDKKTATATITPTADVTITATATEEAATVNVLGTLTHCTVSPTIAENSVSTELTLTADDGYSFTGDTPTATYTYFGYETEQEFTISSDKKKATVTVQSESDITVKATAVEDTATTVSITQTLTHCTSDAPSTATVGESLTVTLTAESGYVFDDTPTITGGTFTVSDDKKTATATITPTADVTITATATEEAATVNVLGTLTHCTVSPTIAENSVSTELTLTADDGYSFTGDTPTATYTYFGYETEQEFTISSDKKKATVTVQSESDITVKATAVEDTATTVSITQTLTHCTSDAPSTATVGESLTVTLTAESGYVFDDTPTITGGTFTVSDDKKTATATITPTADVTITATATAETITGTGNYNVYCPTDEDLFYFSRNRFINYVTESGGFSQEDLGNYVCGLFKLHTPLNTADNNAFQFGNTTFNRNVPILKGDVLFDIDCGTITLEQATNAVEYANTQLRMYLPFIGFVSLGNEVLGHNVKLTYKVSVTTGECKAMVYVDGSLLQENSGSMKSDILYSTVANSRLGDNANVYIGGFQPYIMKTTHTTHIAHINSTFERKKVGEFSGYNEFTDIDMIIENVESGVYYSIVKRLQQGVYISE